MNTIETTIDARIDAVLDEIVEIRHDLHAHPELGYEEVRTSKVIQDFLRTENIQFKSGLAK